MEINKEEIINRIVHLRKDVLDVTSKKLSEMSNTDWSSIRKWESGLTSFKTKTTVFRIVKCFNDAGIYVTEDWLLYGKEPKPKKFSEIKKINFNFEEEDLFRSRIKNLGLQCAIVSIIEEGVMSPAVELGDRIGGVAYFEDFQKYVGQCCIVRFDAGEHKGEEIFRKLQLRPDSPSGFELVTVNSSQVIVPDKIEWVAPLVRRWRY